MKVLLRAPGLRLFAGFSFAICSLFAGAQPAAGQAHTWSQRFGGTSTESLIHADTDGSGNVVVTGWFNGTVDFGGGPLTSAGGTDIYVAKYDADGNHLWSRRFGDTSVDEGSGLATDAAGNVLVTGTFVGSVDFGGGVLVSAGSSETFLVKLDPNGTHVWSRRMGGTTFDEGLAVATDGTGNSFVTGFFRGTSDFGGVPLVSASSDDIFLAKYDPSGAHLWSQRAGGTNVDYGYTVATDASGNVFLGGTFSVSADFGGGLLTSAGTRDAFLAKYSPAGAHLWSQSFGGTGIETTNGIAVDGPGNVIIAGNFQTSVSFGGPPLSSAGLNDIFLAKYNPAGTHLWSTRFGGTSQDSGGAIDIDPWDNVVMAGSFNLTVNFGGSSLISAGSSDAFLAKYSPNGMHLWSQRFGGSDGDGASTVTADASDDVFLAGSFRSTADFGGGPLTSAGESDVVLAKYEEITVAAAFTGVWVQPVHDGVHLRWDVTFDEPISSFRVYRSAEGQTRKLERTLDTTVREYVDADVLPGRTYVYTVSVVTLEGSEFVAPSVTVTVPFATTQLGQNHPNPFNPSTTIDYTLAENATVAIRIYDAHGAFVASIGEGTRTAGNHRVTWDGRDANGRPVSSGVYFYSLNAGKQSLSRRMVLLK